MTWLIKSEEVEYGFFSLHAFMYICVCMYITCMQCLWMSDVGTGCPRTGVEDGYELSYGSWPVDVCPYARVAGALNL